MDKKKKRGKIKKAELRLNNDERNEIKEAAEAQAQSTSEFIRDLLEERRTTAQLNLHLRIAERYEAVLEKYRRLLKECKKKNAR